MMLVASAEAARDLAADLGAAGEKAYEIGRIVPRRPDMAGATVEGMAAAWNA
jgi:phosphoribosylaminoimidazole (AIR) synthetase